MVSNQGYRDVLLLTRIVKGQSNGWNSYDNEKGFLKTSIGKTEWGKSFKSTRSFLARRTPLDRNRIHGKSPVTDSRSLSARNFRACYKMRILSSQWNLPNETYVSDRKNTRIIKIGNILYFDIDKLISISCKQNLINI